MVVLIFHKRRFCPAPVPSSPLVEQPGEFGLIAEGGSFSMFGLSSGMLCAARVGCAVV